MKNYILIVAVCFISAIGFSQNISWETDYLKAKAKVEKSDAVLLVYFVDNKSELKRTIEKDFLRSETLKSTNQNIVILEVNKNIEQQDVYQKRLLKSYNSQSKFPAIQATKPSTANSTELLTTFKVSDKSSFLIAIKNL